MNRLIKCISILLIIILLVGIIINIFMSNEVQAKSRKFDTFEIEKLM